MLELSKEIYTGKVKWNGNHYFSGEIVKGPMVKDATGRVFINHIWEDQFGNEWGDTVEVDSLEECK